MVDGIELAQLQVEAFLLLQRLGRALFICQVTKRIRLVDRNIVSLSSCSHGRLFHRRSPRLLHLIYLLSESELPNVYFLIEAHDGEIIRMLAKLHLRHDARLQTAPDHPQLLTSVCIPNFDSLALLGD